MKVQITIDEQLWRKAKVSAMMRGQSLGELVGVALGDLLKNVLLSDGLGIPVELVREPRKQAKSKDDKLKAEVASVVGPANEDLVDKLCPLKEGYGWCLACKVEQVKLPSVLCPACKKG